MEKIAFDRHLIDQMRSHVIDCLPDEACGLIGGSGIIGSLIIPITNILHSPTQFSMDPIELLRALQNLQLHNLDLLAIFHSHPSGPTFPSQTDIENFLYPGSAVAIWSPAANDWQLSVFWIDNGQFRQIGLQFA